MNTIKISIIIPVYNVEKYLCECINSVISQTYKNLEIILVNDGSLDKSGDICNAYADKDKRIKTIHKTNGGLSSARNAGIEVATGEYITFLDSDDYWDDNNALEEVMNQVKLTNCEVISWGVKKLYEKNKRIQDTGIHIKSNKKINNSKEDSFYLLIKNGCYIASSCNKLIKTDLIIDNKLYFIEGMKSEDIDWCARVAISAKSFEFINNSFYIYRQRGESISKNLKEENIIDLLQAIKICYGLIKENPNIKFKNTYLSYVANQIINTMVCLSIFPKEIQQRYTKELDNYKNILKYGLNNKSKIICYGVKTLGMKNCINLLGLIRKIKKAV